MDRACFLRKTPEFTKVGEIHELFVLALSLVWFAGATPEVRRLKGCFFFMKNQSEGKEVGPWRSGGLEANPGRP